MDEDGHVKHESEYINFEPGKFPNFHFVRELKKALSKNNGSIFRYAPHENTILNAIYVQLEESAEPDKIELQEFIKCITHSTRGSAEQWCGDRDMIDLWSEEELDATVSEMDSIADGGAALTAYEKLQFTDMSPEERLELKNSLLKYCELDTLAMVMIVEFFREEITGR